MILIIRIAGQVGVPSNIKEALFRLRVHRKYAATFIEPTEKNLKLLRRVRDYISYGELDKETILELIQKRAQPLDAKKKLDAQKVAEQLGKKSLKDLGAKPFFRLHPPRGGIDAKKHAGIGKGVLGHNKEITQLVRRML